MGPFLATYDWPAAVTKSDTVDDPAGPFAALYVSVAGNVVFAPLAGPSAGSTLTFAVVAGMVLPFPVKRVNATSTTATVFGLVSAAVVPQGFP